MDPKQGQWFEQFPAKQKLPIDSIEKTALLADVQHRYISLCAIWIDQETRLSNLIDNLRFQIGSICQIKPIQQARQPWFMKNQHTK